MTNRQARRRLKRKKDKDTKYTLSAEQLATIIRNSERKVEEEVRQQIKEEIKKAEAETCEKTFFIPLLVLRNWGWGKIRIKRFADDMVKQWHMFDEGLFSTKDVREMLKEEIKLDLELKLQGGKVAT